jgi:prophage regulatory protein
MSRATSTRLVDDLPQAAHSGRNESPHLPREGFVRLPQILAVFPVSASTWWRGVKSGRYPRGVKLSKYCTAWRVADVRELLNRTGSGEVARGG